MTPKMTTRRIAGLFAASLALFLLAGGAFLLQLPTNVDDQDQSPLYLASFWIAVIALAVSAILVLILAFRSIRARSR